MRIVAFSDIHCQHRNLKVPNGDVLICAGDITFNGELDVLEDFANWMGSLPHTYKCVIAGNHDGSLKINHPDRAKILKFFNDAGIIYLQDSSVGIEGLKFYGSPASPIYGNYAFTYERGKEIAEVWSKIPDDVDILISHGPSHGILDLAYRNINGFGYYDNAGCEELRKTIDARLKNLKLHICGHLHHNGGKKEIHNGITYVNAAVLNDQYQLVNKSVIIDL